MKTVRKSSGRHNNVPQQQNPQQQPTLADISNEYQREQAKKAERQAKKERQRGTVSPSPLLGCVTCGLAVSSSACLAFLNSPLWLSALICCIGCITCTITRGNSNDFDGLGARICMGAALVCFINATVYFAITLKGLGIWEKIIEKIGLTSYLSQVLSSLL